MMQCFVMKELKRSAILEKFEDYLSAGFVILFVALKYLVVFFMCFDFGRGLVYF
jgi:hypothetical protein